MIAFPGPAVPTWRSRIHAGTFPVAAILGTVPVAGTYTPLAVLCLAPGQAAWLLSLVWARALPGIGSRVLWLGAPRWLYVPLYLLLGRAAVMYPGEFLAASR